MSRRDFGNLRQSGSRPGFYARVTWRGVTAERYAGITREIGKRKLAELRSALDKGADLESACAEVFGDTPATSLTFEGASAKFLEFRKGRVKNSTYLGDIRRMRTVCKSPFRERYLADLRPVDFVKWVEERRKKVSVATCNRDLHACSALFEWARRMGHVKANPIREVEKFSEKGRERETFLEADEARELVNAADPVMRPVLACAVSTGMRRGEIMRLSWRSVDMLRRMVFVEPEDAKSGRTRTVPMTEDLFAEMQALHAARKVSAMDGSDPVFRQANGERITFEVMKKGLARTLRACASIPADKRKKITFHSLRHTAGSLLAHATGDLFVVGRILGHADPKTTLRYCHFLPQAGRDSMAKLGNVLALSKREGPEALAK